MDTLRGHDAGGGRSSDRDDFDYGENPAIEAPPKIGKDERRMHVRAYNYWASLIGNRSLPSIEDLNPEEIEDFGPHSVLLDFTAGIDDPAVAYLGTSLRRECGIEGHLTHISDVPPRSLLSRLTDHYLQILANAAPIGFEAEFLNQRGVDIMYRGILMPFSSDDETIDFVYGVINWKEMASRDLTDSLAEEVDRALRSAPTSANTTPVWADGPSAPEPEFPVLDFAEPVLPSADTLDEDAELADWLALAREHAREAIRIRARSRASLYRAIGLAYDFALVARSSPEDYAELLEDAGIKAQARSPMTAVIKLIFGVDYDKTRVTEFATALDHAMGQDMAPGSFTDYLTGYPGGLKGLVRDARAARKAPTTTVESRSVKARRKLSATVPLEQASIATDTDGLAVVVARREADGSLSIVAALSDEAKLAEKVITAAGR